MTIKDFFRGIPKYKLIFLVIFMILAGFDGVVMSQVVSSVTKFNSKSTIQDIVYLLVYGIVSYLFIQLSSMIVSIINNNIIYNLNQYYKKKLVRSMSLSRSANSNTDGILSLLNIDLKLVEEKYFSVILSSLYLIIMGLVSLLYLVYLSPLLAMLFIVCSFLPILPSIIFGPLLSNATVKFTKSSEDVITNINDFSQGIEEIRTYSAFPSFLERSEALIHDMERDYELLGNKHSFIGFSSAMLSWFSYLIPISIALFLVIKGDLDSTIVIAIFLASDRVISPFRSLSDSLRLIKSTEITRKKLCELIDNKNNIVSKTNLNRPDLYFENVSFSYDKDVISNISFLIPYGSKVIITGPSGSGKTTLFNLIQGVLIPTEGKIFIKDGEDIKSVAPEIMSRIYQEPYYFRLSLRDNLLMGEKDIPDTVLYEFLDYVGLKAELGSDCLDNFYGEWGKNLSGGQKQRIEIIRALLHKRKILLVDEGTSSVDYSSAQKIRNIFSKMDNTVFEIAHYYDKQLDKIYTHHIRFEDNGVSIETL